MPAPIYSNDPTRQGEAGVTFVEDTPGTGYKSQIEKEQQAPKKFLTYEDKDRFRTMVIKKLGRDPMDFNVDFETEKAVQGEKRKLFQKVFRGKVSWVDRHKLDPDEAAQWQKELKRFKAHVQDQYEAERGALMQKYSHMMGMYDLKERMHNAEVQRTTPKWSKPQQGINSNTGKTGQYVTDQFGNVKWLKDVGGEKPVHKLDIAEYGRISKEVMQVEKEMNDFVKNLQQAGDGYLYNGAPMSKEQVAETMKAFHDKLTKYNESLGNIYKKYDTQTKAEGQAKSAGTQKTEESPAKKLGAGFDEKRIEEIKKKLKTGEGEGASEEPITEGTIVDESPEGKKKAEREKRKAELQEETEVTEKDLESDESAAEAGTKRKEALRELKEIEREEKKEKEAETKKADEKIAEKNRDKVEKSLRRIVAEGGTLSKAGIISEMKKNGIKPTTKVYHEILREAEKRESKRRAPKHGPMSMLNMRKGYEARERRMTLSKIPRKIRNSKEIESLTWEQFSRLKKLIDDGYTKVEIKNGKVYVKTANGRRIKIA